MRYFIYFDNSQDLGKRRNYIIRTYAESLYLVGAPAEYAQAFGRSPLQMVYNLTFCVSPDHVRLNTYTLEKGRQRAAGAEGTREYWFKDIGFFITDYPKMILYTICRGRAAVNPYH
ncbi:MAG: hypothetical protein F6K17_15625 [Okeania sp. SIO3C4]|nr:hypothetical protein [Okeania sp. SIO3C4]